MSEIRTRSELDGLKPVPVTPCESTAEIVNVFDTHIDVAVVRSACAGCNGRCLGMLNRDRPVPLSRALLPTDLLLRPGQVIRLHVPRVTLIGLSSLVYLLPVVLMLLLAIACEYLLDASEVMTAGAALVGLLAGLLACRRISALISPAIRRRIRVSAVS